MLRQIILYLALSFVLFATDVFTPAEAVTLTNDRVFAYAEANYPTLFPGTAADQQFQQYSYRYYPASANYLAVDTANVIFMLGPDTGNVLTNVGSVASFADAIIAWEALSAGVTSKNGVTATVTGGTSIAVSWTNTCTVCSWQLSTRQGTDPWVIQTVLPKGSTQYTITGLRPGQKYQVKMDAKRAGRWVTRALLTATTTSPPDTTNTSLATPLLNYIAADQSLTTPISSTLNTSIILGADFFAPTPSIMTANYGFEGYMGVPNLSGTGSSAQEAAYAGNVSYEYISPNLQAASRAYYSAVGSQAFLYTYGVSANSADTIPVVFSHPIWPPSVTPAAFQITMNTGAVVTPLVASFLPNAEYNERQTVVITGYWGNRIAPDNSGAEYPVSVSIVSSPTELKFVTALGLVSAVGLNIESKNPYVSGNGPRIVAAKLNVFSSLGESNPQWLNASYANSGSDLFNASAQYRLRVYTSAGFSPDGISSILPTDFSKYFILGVTDSSGNTVQITQAGVNYTIPGYGNIKVLGIADTGPLQPSYDITYIEDHDNQYDIILSGDGAAIARLATIRMPSSGSYSPVYNPGGPGNNPSSNPAGPFTVPSSGQTINITNNIEVGAYVTYVEIDGPVAKNVLGQPIGQLQGAAIINNATGYTVNAYIDPTGKRFYSSFPAANN